VSKDVYKTTSALQDRTLLRSAAVETSPVQAIDKTAGVLT